MDPLRTGEAYDQLADLWNSPTFNRANGIRQHERAIAFARTRGRALDVGCGSSGRFIDLLLSHGYTVEGLDISPRMIELARARHPGIEFHHADICRWEFPAQYDFVSAWDSIWHVPSAEAEAVLRKLLDGLAPGGVCIFTTGGLDAPVEKVDASMGPTVSYSVLGIPKTLEVLAQCGCVCRHLEYDQLPELHVYIIAQKA
ncbi:MAG: class I SAM-dependent methyltransferase [Candidatus Sumerlaeia bacterium]|nr:class I SAM-dependent methyltransferase [Candidatus Sumerlaeia bacterium]